MAEKLGIQTNDDEVCIPSLSSILLAVRKSISAKKLGKESYCSKKGYVSSETT